MKLILVPTDFSENANSAIEYACALGSSLHADLLVVNIFTPAVTKHNVVAPIIQDEINMATKSAEEKLNVIASTIKDQFPEIDCSYQCLVGGVLESIESLVAEKSVDLIVMGTRGASGVSKVLFGSNTSALIENAKCTVLAVPKDLPFKVPKKIIYATDFNDTELKKLVNIMAIGSAFNAEIMMTHITTDKDALESENLLKSNFAKRVSEIYDYPSISYFVKYEDDIMRALETIVNQVDADWIAMLTHKRSFFEKLYNPSLTKEMSFHSKIPLLALKG